MTTVVEHLTAARTRWAFSFSNAGAYYTRFSADPNELVGLNWSAVDSTDFRDAAVKEGKQAEFLVHDFFSIGHCDLVGVVNAEMLSRASAAFSPLPNPPKVAVRSDWYY